LRALSPAATLSRGYAIARLEDGHIVRDASRVDVGATLRVELHRGRLTSTVQAVEPED
jgi:exodeoxyribonuclease VII large subunit